jgi:hypothetical protein
MNERTRAYLYRVGTALIPLLILIGWMTQDVGGAVLYLLAAILAVGEGALASKHTSTKPAPDKQ